MSKTSQSGSKNKQLLLDVVDQFERAYIFNLLVRLPASL